MEALHRAALLGQADALRTLLRAGADVAATDAISRNALHYASTYGGEECVRVLLDAAEEQGHLRAVLNAKDKCGKTPSDRCRDNRCFSLLRQREGLCLDAIDRTAVGVFVNGLMKAVKAMTADCYRGRTPLHIAANLGDEECVRVLLDAAEEQDCLDAVLNAVDEDIPSDASLVSHLLQYGGRGRMALHGAAENGHVGVLRVLLSAGADVAAPDFYGMTALHFASLRGREKCVRILLEAAEEQRRLDAVVNAVNTNGDTPLDVCDDYDGSCVSLLLQRGGRGREALHSAALYGLVKGLKKLLRAGADVAATDSHGRTALHFASLRGREKCVRVLLEAAEEQGRLVAVLNAVDEDGKTPLDVCDDERCAALLRRRGALV